MCDLLLLHLPAVILGQETTLYTCYKNRSELGLMSQAFLRFLKYIIEFQKVLLEMCTESRIYTQNN